MNTEEFVDKLHKSVRHEGIFWNELFEAVFDTQGCVLTGITDKDLADLKENTDGFYFYAQMADDMKQMRDEQSKIPCYLVNQELKRRSTM